MAEGLHGNLRHGIPGSLHSINVSNGGVPKLSRPGCAVRARGLEGDRQRDLRYHGGPSRAVCLYSLDLIRTLQAEGHPIEAGSIGENFTLTGIDWQQMLPGPKLEVGGVLLQRTDYAPPSRHLQPSLLGGNCTRAPQKAHPCRSPLY